MYAVTGVSGNTGSVVASSLLRQGRKVRVIVRNEEKGAQWREQGAEVAVANLDSAEALRQALNGVDGLYFLVPPNFQADDGLGFMRRIVDTLHTVLTDNPIPHIAYLSSIGAQHVAGTGPIRGHHYGEQKLMPLETRFTFIRAAYFMENTASLLPSMRDQGALPVFFDPAKKIPMVSTQDIGETAARVLLEPPAATQVIELAGPVEYSILDASEAYSTRLGKYITPLRIPEEGVVPALRQMGISESVAELFREMSNGIENGTVDYEGGTARFIRGTVTLDAFVQQVLAA